MNFTHELFLWIWDFVIVFCTNPLTIAAFLTFSLFVAYKHFMNYDLKCDLFALYTSLFKAVRVHVPETFWPFFHKTACLVVGMIETLLYLAALHMTAWSIEALWHTVMTMAAEPLSLNCWEHLLIVLGLLVLCLFCGVAILCLIMYFWFCLMPSFAS